MIVSEKLVIELSAIGIDFFAGVPDSLLKDFCGYLERELERRKHIITANEGSAIASASGYFLSTGKPALVYMQNSGLGNAVNPLVSLTSEDVYQIPMVLMIGWRGEPGKQDEPQHQKQGKITIDQLKLANIPHLIIDEFTKVEEISMWISNSLEKYKSPIALVVKNGTFSKYENKTADSFPKSPSREDAIKELLPLLEDSILISTTGKTSRELFELRQTNLGNQRDFMMVGAMGHASSVALGVALNRVERSVVCLDGDGAALMHLGALATIGKAGPENFTHVLLNNSAHESVGGQPTGADGIDFGKLALSLGYRKYRLAEKLEDVKRAWLDLQPAKGPNFLEIRIKKGSRKDLGRPSQTPQENKQSFMQWVSR